MPYAVQRPSGAWLHHDPLGTIELRGSLEACPVSDRAGLIALLAFAFQNSTSSKPLTAETESEFGADSSTTHLPATQLNLASGYF